MSKLITVLTCWISIPRAVTLDDINDLYKKDALNSSQRDALYNIYTKETDLSDQNVIDIIEGALLIADRVEDIDTLKLEADNYEREWNLAEVARLRYSEIPNKEKEIIEAEETLKTLHKNWKTFLRDKVEPEDIAEIIGKWTGIPATKLLQNEKENVF